MISIRMADGRTVYFHEGSQVLLDLGDGLSVSVIVESQAADGTLRIRRPGPDDPPGLAMPADSWLER